MLCDDVIRMELEILRRYPSLSAVNKFRLALVQLQVSLNKEANIKRAADMVREAAGKGAAKMIALPVSEFALWREIMKPFLDRKRCVYRPFRCKLSH